ncbi:MAG: hypothetical protein JWO00_520 [Candidatus Parcubacteria bacterium]|nr:hypothetical protein [Candidatus Parcubacteria bacterium]
MHAMQHNHFEGADHPEGESLSRHTIHSKSDIHEKGIETHLERIQHEFRNGFDFLKKYPKSVTIFGSSMTKPESPRYAQAQEVASRIIKDTGYAVLTGGGPGIMEAVSKGAKEAGGPSVGLRIHILREHSNSYLTDSMNFTYFFARKAMLAFAAETYIFMPGGYGTFDELFGILTLIQTGKIPRVPIILFDSSFWNPIKEYIATVMLGEDRTIDPHDMDLFEVTDSADRVVEIIRKAPTSEWWRSIN